AQNMPHDAADDGCGRRAADDAEAAARGGDRALARLGEGLEVHAGAEGAAGTCQRGSAQLGVAVELVEGHSEGIGGREVDRVAPVRPGEGDDEDGALALCQQVLVHRTYYTERVTSVQSVVDGPVTAMTRSGQAAARRTQAYISPPSVSTIAPVIIADASESRNETTSATCSG